MLRFTLRIHVIGALICARRKSISQRFLKERTLMVQAIYLDCPYQVS